MGKAQESQIAYGNTSQQLQENPFHNLDLGDSALGDDKSMQGLLYEEQSGNTGFLSVEKGRSWNGYNNLSGTQL